MIMQNRKIDKLKVLQNAGGKNGAPLISDGEAARVRDMVSNASLMRSTLLNKLIDSRRDIDLECGYPKELTTEQYKLMYDREGVATRVVNLYPEESWGVDPEVVEDEGADDTEFEAAFKTLEKDRQLWSYLYKIDEISGIGRYGILLLGLNDGKALSEPVEGINEKGEKVGNVQHQLLYLRVFDESSVSIRDVEKDLTNPRYGKPLYYNVSFDSIANSRTASGEIVAVAGQDQLVHWSRVIHIADNRRSSEVYGVPRMQTLFNRLYDIRKIAGGSGEMFWKGGFPGYSFEMDSNARPLTADDKTELKDEIANYANGLQRYITLQGVTAKSLSPQLADPKSHIDVQLEIIAIALGVPKRIFMGAEQAKLASSQDSENWNKRLARRQNKYLTPYVIRPTIDRLIEFGVLPEPTEYDVRWPDMDAPSDDAKATVLTKQVEAFAKYVGGGVDALIPPEIFMSMFAGLSSEQVEEIMKAAVKREHEMVAAQPAPQPVPPAGEEVTEEEGTEEEGTPTE